MNDVQDRLKAAAHLLQTGHAAEAEQCCLEALGLQPEQPDALNLLGLARRAMGDLDIADKAMVRAINAAPNRADFYLNLGNLRRSRGNLPQAAQLYAFALEQDSRAYEARLYLGETFLEMGMGQKALEYLAPLSVLKGRDARFWRSYAEALKAEKRFDDALKAFDRALTLKPDYTIARHNKAALLNDLGRHEEALRELDIAEQNGLKCAENHINRAHALMGMGKLDAAADEYTYALTRNPELSQAHIELGNLLWMTGRDALATKTIEAARKRNPDNHELPLAHANLLRQMGRVQEAETTLRDAFPDTSNFPRTASMLARLLMEQNRFDEALLLSQRAVEALPVDEAINDTLISALFGLGRYDEAFMASEKRLAFEPDDQRWIAYRATALRAMGKAEYAEIYNYQKYVRAFDLSPPAGWVSVKDFLTDIRRVLDGMHLFDRHPLNQSLRLGSQTTRDLSAAPDPVLKAFFKALDEPIRAYMADLGRGTGAVERRNTGNYRFNGAWSIKLKPGGFHVNHVHPKGWISSSFYVDVPEVALDTPEREGWIKFGEPGVKTRDPMAAEHWVRPRAGRLVLFPSYMWHGTVPFHHGPSRLTLPFDVIPL